MVSCLIRSVSATITLDSGAQISIPRRANDPPERTAKAVASLLCIDRFEYALTPSLRFGPTGSRLAVRGPALLAL
ncbi:MAG: hypothetical protein WA688_09740 [Thermoplasmata archaeon]